ncbi:sensor histidine kinase [Chryseolinea lacunae]|uniref:histidine kinase n=1 Tax=Chryseolinea lacunae TaxID=2801331 RepID=A0ABS1KP95_9BACT|nr:sensor histidine kinase [Chryseolinea lacunae]MBL0741143.1 hypothetical protein [Chryseolinea lacunae]
MKRNLYLCPSHEDHIGWFSISLLWICFLSFFPISLHAQSSIRFERITVDDGLSQSAVTSMRQDKYGYLWIGTQDGLNRYDGNSFTVYRHDLKKPTSFPAHRVNKLFLDANENLWISYQNGLSRYEREHDDFKNYKIKVEKENVFIRNMDHLSDTLMVLSTSVGVLHFNPRTGKTHPAQSYSRFNNQNVNGIVSSSRSGDWLFTDRSIWRSLKGGRGAWTEFFTDEDQLRYNYFKSSDELYVRTGTGLWKYDTLSDRLKLIATLPKIQWPNSTVLFKTTAGTLWVAHGNISIFKNDSLSETLYHAPQDPNSLSGAFASDIYQTRDGVIWVGTNGLGLNKYDPSRSAFRYLGSFPGAPLTLADNYVNTVSAIDDQRILVSTIVGMNEIDLKNKTSKYFPVMTRNKTDLRVSNIRQDADGKAWLATNSGLMIFDGKTVVQSGNSHLNDPALEIYDILKTNVHEFLLSTNRGLLSWDQAKNSVTVLHNSGTIVMKQIGTTVWFESDEKLKIMRWNDKQIIKTFPTNGTDSLHAPRASLKCIYQDRDKNIWLGTDGGGLALYDSTTQTFMHFDETEGLSNTVVYGILEDQFKNLWLSTNEGLNVFDRKSKRVIRRFNKNDGLQGNEFNTRAFFKSASGRMYFGGVNGLTFFDPEEVLKIPSLTPKTVLTGFFIDNVKQSNLNDAQIDNLFNANAIELEWSQRNFSFEIAGLGFTFPSGVQHQYKLDGFDQTWNSIGGQNRISFTNMPAGNYTLHIRSGNAFNDWEKEGLVIRIVITEPLWRSPWFIGGAICILVLSLFLFSHQRAIFLKKRTAMLQSMVNERTRQIQQQQEEIAAQNEELTAQAEALENSNLHLENQVKRRTSRLQQLNKALADQNTQLEQFTFITAHNIRGPIARISGLINLLNKESNEREIVNHLKTSINSLDDVISDLTAVLNITQGVNKTFELVSVREQLIRVLEMLQQDIQSVGAIVRYSEFEDVKILGTKAYFQSILFNLIHNALKFTDHLKTPVITCRAEKTSDGTIITIEDNGLGIDMRYAKDKIFQLHQRFHPNVVGRGLGLFLVKTQVKAMGGSIGIESTLGQGTIFSIRFPEVEKGL